MNVCDTSSHGDIPMCQNGKPMSNKKKVIGQTDRQTDRVIPICYIPELCSWGV